MKKPVIVGQVYSQIYPDKLTDFISIDSAPLAEAYERDLPYEIKCPALLICGEKDRAGSCVRYNKAWHKNTGIPIAWIKDAGHNSNTDQPEIVNRLMEEWINATAGCGNANAGW